MNTFMKKNRNAVIELLRFIYASCILIFHISRMDLNIASKTLFMLGPWKANFFRMGNLGVEFFFIVSGYLMASSVYNANNTATSGVSVGGNTETSGVSLGEETISFIFRKVKSIYSYYLSGSILISVIWFLEGSKISSILKCLPSLLFLQRTGISEEKFLKVTWYISSMLIAIAVIYPFLKKYYYTFTTLIAPVGGILIVGALIKNYGDLQNSFTWIGFTYKCNLRAIAEISLGAACFEVSRRLKDLNLSRGTRLLLSVTAIIFLQSTIVFMCSDASEYGGLFLLMICFIVTVVFARKVFEGDNTSIYRNKLFVYLGSISVPMFFYQDIFRNLIPKIFDDSSKKILAVLIYVSTVLFSMLMKALMDRYNLEKAVRSLPRK